MSGRLILLSILLAAAPAGAQTKLNSFVTQFVDQASPAAGDFEVNLDRAGWLLVRFDADAAPSASLDASALTFRAVTVDGVNWHESMRRAEAGKHIVRLDGAEARRMQIRRIPEIRYCSYQYDPWVYHYGPYDWAFLSKHVLPHVNTVVGSASQDQSDVAAGWRDGGGKWIVETTAPGMFDDSPPKVADPQKAAELLIQTGGLDRPWVDGVLLDEYYPDKAPIFPLALAGMRGARQNGQLKGKSIEPYLAGDPGRMAEFVRQAAQLTDRMFIEMYNCEQPDETAAREYLNRRIEQQLQTYREIAGPERAHVFGVCLGQMSGPPESLNTLPQVNYRVFQDMEFELLANSSAIDRVDAIMEYTAGYAEEETIRWVGKLYRHYCIEGKTTRLSDERYIANHLENPDFANGTRGWTIQAAAEDSVQVEHHKDFGRLMGRYGAGEGVGDAFLVMRRDAKAPNVVSQTLKNLQSGKLYALRLYSGGMNNRQSSYGNPTLGDVTRPRIEIAGVEALPDRSIDHLFRSINTSNVLFFGYHLRLFRATESPAELSISDWKSLEHPGGNANAPTGITFVEVVPYLEFEGQ